MLNIRYYFDQYEWSGNEMMIALCGLCLSMFCFFLFIGWKLRFVVGFPQFPSESMAVAPRSAAYYSPMARLLADDDLRFLQNSKGVSAASLLKLRANRRRLFRSYLASLCADFAEVTAQIRHVMVVSKVSRDDLFTALLKARFLFAIAVLAVEFRLMLHACGIAGVPITGVNVTSGFATMRNNLAYLMAELTPELRAEVGMSAL